MAVIKKSVRLANPYRRKKAKAKRRKANPRRKLTANQIKFFGTKQQRAALKRRKKSTVKRRRSRTTNPAPAYIVTLGAVNPSRRKSGTKTKKRRVNSMAKRRRKNSARRSVAVMSYKPRKRRRSRIARRTNPSYSRRVRRTRRRNPSLFGTTATSVTGVKLVLGGLAGVAAAKFLPRLVPAGITGSMGNFASLVTTGVAAWAASYLGEKAMGEAFGNAVLFGGLMQTGSVAMNMLLPGFQVGGVPIALSGMGDLLPGQFVVPQNPLLAPPMAVAPPVNANMSGLSRAFPSAF